MDRDERIHAELEHTSALLAELYPQLHTLAAQVLTASSDDLPRIETEATRLISAIEQQTAKLRALQEK